MNDHALCAPSKESSAGMSRRMKHALSADNGSSSVTRGDHVSAPEPCFVLIAQPGQVELGSLAASGH
eukprot:3565713-Rhodomonas_salina.1